jgi:hypothetical protein
MRDPVDLNGAKARWSEDSGRFAAEVVNRLQRNGRLTGLGLGEVDGRVDLRGLTTGAQTRRPTSIAGVTRACWTDLVADRRARGSYALALVAVGEAEAVTALRPVFDEVEARLTSGDAAARNVLIVGFLEALRRTSKAVARAGGSPYSGSKRPRHGHP